VRAGETLASISRSYRVSLTSIIAANPGIDPRRIRPGQVVRIPPR
jgi:LysM repeat protein